jgi:DNA-binding HxlR family transcriptional regulator
MRRIKEKLCPVARVADIVGDFYTVLIIRDLVGGTKRFKDLELSLVGISTRTLVKKLKILEEHDMVKRSVYKEKPPRVEYSLTKKGRQLGSITKAMKVYGEKYLAEKATSPTSRAKIIKHIYINNNHEKRRNHQCITLALCDESI